VKYKGAFLLLGGLFVGVLLGLAVLFSGTGQPGSSARQLPPTIGSPVRDFELPDLDGSSLSLSSLQDKPVVINFWATWCGPCKEEMPLLDQFAIDYSDEMVVLGVNFAESPDVVARFVKEERIGFPILLDESGNVNNLYFVRNYPTTFFIDGEGVLRAQHIGLLSEETLQRNLSLIGID